MAKVPFSIDSRFLSEVRAAVYRFACNYCSSWATADDCEDLTQQAMLTMFEHVQNGKLKRLDCSLATYVNGILKKLALKESQKKGKAMLAIDPLQSSDGDDDRDPVDVVTARNVIDLWLHDEQAEEAEELKDALQRIVTEMADPCKTILWLYYWDNLSMKEIAEKMNYDNARVAISQKSRCMTKVKTAIEEIRKQLRS